MRIFISASLAMMLSISEGTLCCLTVYGAPGTSQSSAFVKAKPLTENVKSGLDYLVKVQNDDGSWSQGEESQHMRSVGQKNGDLPNVADTCMAALALVRAGNYPNSGPYASNLAKAASYISSQIEESDNDSLLITKIQGTRVQAKLGQYVDTFLASVFLPEIKGRMPNQKLNTRIACALDKVIHKIEKNQGTDGNWASNGWAPIHSQSLAMQGLNRARQVGAKVNDEVLGRAERYARRNFDTTTRTFAAEGSAGVPLYSAGATLGGLQSSINTGFQAKPKLEKIAKDSRTSPKARADAEGQLRRYKENESAQEQAIAAVSEKLNNQRFVQGFGCNGGEEFLSYMQISETLLTNKSKDWNNWDQKITSNINHVQNNDGSWMGQHCITSRTFCTAAALLVLIADRSSAIQTIASAAVKNK